ncbi:hypothetical protein P2G88_06685 [Aliiglaciecola sp. CAU 1673]|uniref:hypothetical protein n=1 Tax=Aliiglaciecola sp. CAU 1673 TaxID=3032595 RepID=UPI0023D9E406|nr:hypothetical protein [Aliiglaciecola sp. CAU 1673]MDF2177933.1 hypothetical protein [Aliiglaciecola sp. CAU 1673]
MLAFSPALILSPSIIDQKIISPLRNQAAWKLNNWRNEFAKAIGFDSFNAMNKRKLVLIESGSIMKSLQQNINVEDLNYVFADLTTCYVPRGQDWSLYFGIWKDDFQLLPHLYEDHGRGLWHPNIRYLELGQRSLTKEDVAELRAFVSESLEEGSADSLEYLPDELLNKAKEFGSERKLIGEWFHSHIDHVHPLLSCKSHGQLLATICDVLGEEAEQWLASWGCSLSDLISYIYEHEDSELYSEAG